MPQDEGLSQLIRERIAKHGALTIADYMALALSHPEYGYYMRKDPLGVAGDFTTSPEISQIFGEMIGAWLAAQWQAMGKPECALVELGPGRGTLMNDILRATRFVPSFHDSISVHLVESSPVLQQKQWQTLANKHKRLSWHAEIGDLPDKPLLLVANEFFDALPIHQYVCENGAWRERTVALSGDKLCFAFKDTTLDRQGSFYERCPEGLRIAGEIGKRLIVQGGVAIAIDYGYGEGSHADTLQAVKNHGYHDPLLDPGSADLTAHVDFAALAQAAAASGANAYGPQPQGRFLYLLGIAHRVAKLCEGATPQQKAAILSGVERLTSPDGMGSLFKVLCVTSPQHPKPEGF
jgi:NADH dehydrogenase [ubiquinone] 1 alpha subcomplex assembly factor 7